MKMTGQYEPDKGGQHGRKLHSGVGNRPFTDKKKVYENYPYEHIRKIAEKSEWTQKEITTRSEEIFNKFETLRT